MTAARLRLLGVRPRVVLAPTRALEEDADVFSGIAPDLSTIDGFDCMSAFLHQQLVKPAVLSGEVPPVQAEGFDVLRKALALRTQLARHELLGRLPAQASSARQSPEDE